MLVTARLYGVIVTAMIPSNYTILCDIWGFFWLRNELGYIFIPDVGQNRTAKFRVFKRDHAVAQLVYATSRKVAGSIPDGVTAIFR